MGIDKDSYTTVDCVKPGDFVNIVPRTWWSTFRGKYKTETGIILTTSKDPKDSVRVYTPSKGIWTVFPHQWYFRKLNP